MTIAVRLFFLVLCLFQLNIGFAALNITDPVDRERLSNIIDGGNANVNIIGCVDDPGVTYWFLWHCPGNLNSQGSCPANPGWTLIKGCNGTGCSLNIPCGAPSVLSGWDTLGILGDQTLMLEVLKQSGPPTYFFRHVQVQNFNLKIVNNQYDISSGFLFPFYSTVPFKVKETLRIVNEAGTTVRTLVNNQNRNAGEYQDLWDGKNNSGVYLPSGAYFAVADVTSNLGSLSSWSSGKVLGTFEFVHPCIGPFDPTNTNFPVGGNLPVFQHSFTTNGKITLALSTTYVPFGTCTGHTGANYTCEDTSVAFCMLNQAYRPKNAGYRWSGIDPKGKYRSDVKGFVMWSDGSQFPANAVVLKSKEPSVGIQSISPLYYNPLSGIQTTQVSFGCDFCAAYPLNLEIAFWNQGCVEAGNSTNWPQNCKLQTSIHSIASGAQLVNLSWDGKSNGMYVAPGMYIVVATVTDAIGNVIKDERVMTIEYN